MSMTPNEEILSVIRYAPGPIGVAAIYEQCKGIENISDVSSRLSQLFAQGKVARQEITTANNRKGFAYTLPERAPAPAETTATPDATPNVAVATPDVAPPAPQRNLERKPATRKPADAALPITSLGESLDGAAGKTARRTPAPKADDAEVARGLDLVERQQQAERLADSILARLRRELAPIPSTLEGAAGTAGLHIHVHIARVEVHL